MLTRFTHLINKKVCLPLMVRRKSGRPAIKRIKSALKREAPKRRKTTCSRCLKEGHTKRKCTYMPAPNAP